MDQNDYLILFSLIILFFTSCYPRKETFQKLNYIQLHNYLECCQNYGCHSPKCQQLKSGKSKQTGNIKGSQNNPVTIGYLYSSDPEDNETYQLYKVFDHKRGRPGYAYKDTKYQDNREAILVIINPKQYDGDYLYNGYTVNIGYDNKPYTVKLYKIKKTGLGTRYREQNYRDDMYEYALLQPTESHDGEIDENDKYFILYEQRLDNRRDVNNYYIKDKRGNLLSLDSNIKKIDNNDEILIPGKEKYGKYVVNLIDKY